MTHQQATKKLGHYLSTSQITEKKADTHPYLRNGLGKQRLAGCLGKRGEGVRMIPRAVRHEWEKEWVAPAGSAWERIYHPSLHLYLLCLPRSSSESPSIRGMCACTNGWQLIRGAHITCHSSHSCSRIVSLAFLPGLVATDMISVPPRSLLCGNLILPAERG